MPCSAPLPCPSTHDIRVPACSKTTKSHHGFRRPSVFAGIPSAAHSQLAHLLTTDSDAPVYRMRSGDVVQLLSLSRRPLLLHGVPSHSGTILLLLTILQSPTHVVFQDWPNHRPHCNGEQTLAWEHMPNTITDTIYRAPTDAWDWTSDVASVVGLLAHPLMGAYVHLTYTYDDANNAVYLEYPQFVQVALVHRTQCDERSPAAPVLVDFFRHRCARMLLCFGAHMRFLSSPFHVFFCLDSFVTNSHPNRAIASMVHDVHPSPSPWPGSILVLKLSGGLDKSYVSVHPVDVLDIREYFVHFKY